MVLDTSAALIQPSGAMRIDEAALLSYLLSAAPGLVPVGARLQSFQFAHGQSNPTYLIKIEGGIGDGSAAGQRSRTLVLRKKPPGRVLPSAHAVEREYAVISALQSTPVPVARTLALCEDPSVLGTPFYVMEHVSGSIYDDPTMPDASPSQRGGAYQAMARTLAMLHSVRPADVGLGRYGAPSGYNSRQVRRWAGQYLKSVQGQPMPEMLKLAKWLESNLPAGDEDPSTTRITHGDYRLDNLVFARACGTRVLAVLDWELSTLGDPLADLAYCCMPYHLPSDIPKLPSLPKPLPPGIPSEREFVEMYCKARGIPSPLESGTWPFYLALSLFRLASILAGVGARAAQGNASSRVAAQVGAESVVRSLAQTALRIAGQPAPSAPISSSASNSSGSPVYGLGPSPRVRPILKRLEAFMRDHVFPAEPALNAHAHSEQRWTIHPVQEELKRLARAEGLWNLWIAANMASEIQPLLAESGLPAAKQALLLGPGLSNLEYAHCAEIMGQSVWAPEAFNCGAPDTGNMEVLARYGSREQQRRWLLPLLDGTIRSAFAMTEPAVASSDATNIESNIRREGNSYVLNGRKWWISGASDPRCSIFIFMGKNDTAATAHKQQSMVLVPADTPGVTVVRPVPVFGFDDAPHGHAEITFESVRVPAENMILGEGRGFEIAQGRLGPGRLHHCMRLIGMGDRALSLLCSRALSRVAFGHRLAHHQAVRMDIAHSRLELDAARLVVLEAAHALDEVGNKAARGKIAAAKALAPTTALAILDRAIQTYGGAGVSDTTPLAHMWAGARTLRLADGPDIVHLETIAKMELTAAAREAAAAGEAGDGGSGDALAAGGRRARL